MPQQNNLPSYEEYLELKNNPDRSYEENQFFGTLTKRVIVEALQLFGFLDKPSLMFLLGQNNKNQGSFYRTVKILIDEQIIKKIPSEYTKSKNVYVLKPKAFRTFLDADIQQNYQFNKNKMGLGVMATHNLQAHKSCIQFLAVYPAARILTEKRIRALNKAGRLQLFRIPDAIIIHEEVYYFVEFEFSTKNRKDRREAIIKADMNCQVAREKYPEADILTIWFLNSPSMLRLFEDEIFNLVHYKTEVSSKGGLAERAVLPYLKYKMYSIKKYNHEPRLL